MKRLLFILLFSILWIQSSLGQQYYTRNYTVNDGLSDNSIRDIYKDKRGFLWLGTDAGLSQFDGKNFKTYTSLDGLAGDKIWSITENEKGHIWIGCHDGGISKLIGSKIISYSKQSGLVSDYVRRIYYSSKYQILLIGTEDGLSVLKDERFISFHQKHNNVIGRLQITHFIEEDDFIYVFTNGSGLYKFIPDAESLIRIPSDNPLNKPQVSSAYISNFGDTLINCRRKTITSISKGSMSTNDTVGQVMDYVEDSENNIWVAAWNNNYLDAGGLFKYENSSLESFGKYLDIKSRNVLSLAYDSEENLLWIGTKEDGLFLYPLTNFAYYRSPDFNLKNLNITDFAVDSSKNLWIATKKNIIKKDRFGKFIQYPFGLFESKFNSYVNSYFNLKYNYLIDENGSYQKYQDMISNNTYQFSNPYKKLNGKTLPPKSLYKPLKYDILIHKKLKEFNIISTDQKGNIWVGSNVGIFKMDTKTEKISFFDLEGNQLSNFFIDSEDRIYGVNWADLFIYPDIENNFSFDLYNYYEHKSPINVSKIIETNGEIWFASTDHGIFVLKNGDFYSTLNQDILETPSFNDICKDNNGRIIAGGNNGKIYILQFDGSKIEPFKEIGREDGLQGTSIRFLCCTKNNLLVAGTNLGLNLIDLNQLYSTEHTNVNYLYKTKGFTDYSGTTCITQNDEILWIGSDKNLIQINLKSLEDKQTDHINLYLKSILVNNAPYDLHNIENIEPWTNIPKDVIKLPHHKNSLTFNYDAITFLDPDNILFSYKLEGFHNEWVEETNERKAIFQNLEPGRYRLRIKVSTTKLEQSTQELSIGFIIAKPFWLKWWFITAFIIVIFLNIWIIIIIRTRTIQKKERLRSEIAERTREFEMKALRAQMNPHFIFNAINSIQNYMLDNDIDSALSYLSDFAKLIRLTLDNVSKKQVTLEEELNYIKYYISLEQMRFDKEFETEIILPQDWDSGKIMIPSMILQPFVENSIKHGFILKKENAKIKLEFQITNQNILKCIIEDNGIGREKSRELNKNRKNSKSKGTFITNERLALLNQTQQRKGYKIEITDLYNESRVPSGTKVEVFIPI